MSKIYVSEQKINSEILSNLNNAINNLNSSIYRVGVLNIPQSFEYASYLKKMMRL